MFFRSVLIFSMIIAILSCTAESDGQPKDVTIKTDMDSVAYSLGYNWGMNFRNDSLVFNLDILMKGMYDAAYGDTSNPMLTKEEISGAMMGFQSKLQAIQQSRQAKLAEGNRSLGTKFLEENKTKEGVKVTESGLQYKVVKEGTGRAPAANNTVKVHYTGKLIDGTIFDSSVQKGQPATFTVNGLIPGFTEALLLMKEGGKMIVFIPDNLAYGDRGAGQFIKPNATLIFEIELLEIVN